MGIEGSPRQTNPDERMKNPHEDEPNDLVIETVSNPEKLIDQETKRVRWYLKEWKRYKELGYDSVIRLPAGIDPANENITDEEIRAAIKKEFGGNQADYEAYARTFQETWSAIREKMLPLMKQLYGLAPVGHFRIAPTAYGTGGGSLEKGEPVFFRLPKFRPNAGGTPITEVEAITHEILCHECTASLREKTALDDSPIFATHQDVKEVLMDYLGRTLLVRSGLMKREEVRMVGGGSVPEGFDFDALYYADPTNPNENNLRYEGRLPELVTAITEKLKEVPHVSYIESLKFKEAVRKLEVDSTSPQNKLVIIATALGLKPAGALPYKGTDREKKELTQTMSELGLFFEENKDLNQAGPDEDGRKYTFFDIANTLEKLSPMHTAMSTEEDVRYGRAMGFPETAIRAYSEARKSKDIDASGLLLLAEEYEKVLTEEEKAFLFFRLSKENWKKEIEWVEQIIAAVKKHSPEIYKQIMERARR